MRFGVPFLCLLFALSGCDSTEPGCEPGEVRDCPGMPGGQTCEPDGVWGVCEGIDPDAGNGLLDAGSTTDAGTTSDAGAPGCGSGRPDVSGISGTEGVVIARDGTLYYSQAGAVGRLSPGGAPESLVLLGGGGTTVWGMVLDAANARLFVGLPGQGVFEVDLSASPPSASLLVTGGSPNGLTMGPDGLLYYSDFSAGRVYRVDPAGGAPVEVTTSAVPGANGVAFAPDGTLLVCSYSTGELLRLTLTAGVESARGTVASSLGSPDGVAVDEDGRIYVTDNAGGALLRLEADGTGTMTLLSGIPAAASVEFGSGALTCSDIYVASSGPLARFETGSAAGASVPWH